MAAAPALKIYTPQDEYIGCVKYTIYAALLMAGMPDGSTVRLGHRKRDIVYTEGASGCAAESYDEAAEKIQVGIDALHAKARAERERRLIR